MRRQELASRLDHTLLDPAAGRADYLAAADEGRRLGTASLCVPSSRVALVHPYLDGALPVCAVVGFPHGNGSTGARAREAELAVRDGARELDVVIAVGALRHGEHGSVREDLTAVVGAAGQAPVKVILETGYLDARQIRVGCELSIEAGAAYVKTSTGFGPRGASVDDVHLMRDACDERARIKAAGGIRDARFALALLTAGAQRLGTSRSAQLLASLPEP